MRVLFVGDVFGEPGLRAVAMHLPDLRPQYDLVIVNGENAHHGKGLSKPAYRKLREAGADLITLGNHAWNHKDIYELIETEPIIRALNYPPRHPGPGPLGARGRWGAPAGDAGDGPGQYGPLPL